MLHILRQLENNSAMKSNYTRREMLSLTGKAAALCALAPQFSFAAEEHSSNSFGAVVGEPVAAKIGEQFLRDGGNAIDAAVVTAFASAITSPGKCGIGGYGGHGIVALAGGKKISAFDFHSPAPAAARDDMYPLDEKGRVIGNVNIHGWLAVGVPGTLAGLELILERHGTRSLRDVLAPAIQLCEGGVVIAKETKAQAALDASRNDPRPESARENAVTQKQRNLPLAGLLKTLAKRNSVESYYRGDIAKTIAAAFQKNGGLLTEKDLAAYRAREVKPLTLEWNGRTIHTVPLASCGAMMLEAISILKALDWTKLSEPERLHAKLEALRVAWVDRTHLFGDPEFVNVPLDRLLSRKYAAEMAEKIRVALKEQKPVSLETDSDKDAGTINISAVDKKGNMAAITLTHGSGFGARVSVEEFGMVLGHDMWRFDPRPGRPNSVGPGKRSTNNMCPSVVTRDGKPILAIGGAGGTRIPNSIYEVLLNYVGLDKSMEDAMNAPRLDTDGTLKLGLEKGHSPEQENFLKQIGYKVSKAPSAYVSAVSFDAKKRETHGISRGGS
jgi:gamma-glutamyltranspeptidase/glutathione hydrolase